MADKIGLIEKEAQNFFEEEKYEEALKLFSRAAGSYQDLKQHQQAAVCFASAAGCCESQAGRQALFYYAPTYYVKAAREAEMSGDFEYASMLYKHAGIWHERNLEYEGFSECFYLSKECNRKSLMPIFYELKQAFRLRKLPRNLSFKFENIVPWLLLSLSSIVWGHGERPQRTVIFGGFLVLISAILYVQGHFIVNAEVQKPGFLESLYFSVLTMTRIGYGDIVPVGFNKFIAIFQEFVGIFLIPLFLTGLCRKYLRFQ